MLLRCLMAVFLSVATALPVQAQSVLAEPKTLLPDVIDLGGGRYRLGQLEIDRNSQSFTVPGWIIDLGAANAPIEFLVIERNGVKAYESLIEIDTDAIRFNLACILIGLEAKHAQVSRHLFDKAPVEGDRVELFLSWQSGEEEVRRPLGELILVEGVKDAEEEWVYTGSSFTPDGVYLAKSLQVIVGAVHEPWSIIQHHSGLGVGNYGAITYDPDIMPKPRTPVVLEVRRLAAGESVAPTAIDVRKPRRP